MNSATATTSVVELLLWAAFAYLFRVRGFQRRFRATGACLILRTILASLLLIVLSIESAAFGEKHHLGVAHAGDLAVHIADAVLVFFVCAEVFRSVLSIFPETFKLTIVVFRWVVVVSVIVTLTSISHVSQGFHIDANSFYDLMRLAGVLELCLWAFVYLSIHALRLPAREMAVGIMLGSGIMSAGDLVLAFRSSHIFSTTAPVQFVGELLMFAALGVWIAYCMLAEPASKTVFIPANSTIYRWNEIATALGHSGTKVAMQQPGGINFLSDVERVVESVLTTFSDPPHWPPRRTANSWPPGSRGTDPVLRKDAGREELHRK